MNVCRWVLGQHRFNRLIGATLDRRDEYLARRLLANPAKWDSSEIRAYEADFEALNASRHAVSFSAGRVALAAVIEALELPPGSDVLVPGYTCSVVPNAFEQAGLNVRYFDIELDTYGPDLQAATAAVTPNTRAIVLQHLYGIPARDTHKIVQWAREQDLLVIEDCAQSTGASLDGVRLGNFGDAAIYSSELSKSFTTVQGGLASTPNEDVAKRLRDIQARWGDPPAAWTRRCLENVRLTRRRYGHPRPVPLERRLRRRMAGKQVVSTTDEEAERSVAPSQGRHRLPAPLATLGRRQLGKLDALNRQRRAQAAKWRAWAQEAGFPVPKPAPGAQPGFVRYPVLVPEERKSNREWAIRELGVVPGRWFVSHIHPGSRVVNGCPNADYAIRHCINLPGLVSRWPRC